MEALSQNNENLILIDQTQNNGKKMEEEIQKILIIPKNIVISYLYNIKLKPITINIKKINNITDNIKNEFRKCKSKSRANSKAKYKCIRNVIDNEIVDDFNMYIKSIDTNTNETNELLQKIYDAINDYYNLYIDDNQILYNYIICKKSLSIDNDETLKRYKSILYYLFYCYYMYTNEFPPKQFKNTILSTISEGSNEDNSKGGKTRRKTYKKRSKT